MVFPVELVDFFHGVGDTVAVLPLHLPADHFLGEDEGLDEAALPGIDQDLLLRRERKRIIRLTLVVAPGDGFRAGISGQGLPVVQRVAVEVQPGVRPPGPASAAAARLCLFALVAGRLLQEFRHIGQRHHSAESESDGEDAEDEAQDVVPVVPSFLVRRDFLLALDCHADGQHESQDHHNAADARRPFHGVEPEFLLLPETGEIHPVRDGAEPGPHAFLV